MNRSLRPRRRALLLMAQKMLHPQTGHFRAENLKSQQMHVQLVQCQDETYHDRTLSHPRLRHINPGTHSIRVYHNDQIPEMPRVVWKAQDCPEICQTGLKSPHTTDQALDSPHRGTVLVMVIGQDQMSIMAGSREAAKHDLPQEISHQVTGAVEAGRRLRQPVVVLIVMSAPTTVDQPMLDMVVKRLVVLDMMRPPIRVGTRLNHESAHHYPAELRTAVCIQIACHISLQWPSTLRVIEVHPQLPALLRLPRKNQWRSIQLVLP